MKRTEIERKDRDLKKAQKKEDSQLRKSEKSLDSVMADYSEQLFKLFIYNEEKIYNIKQSADILVLVDEMKQQLEPKDLESALHKAIRLTKVKAKKQNFDELLELLNS